MDRSARKLLRQTIYVAEPTGRSRAGDRAHGAPVARAARVEPDQSVQDTSANGETVVSTYRIFLVEAVSQTAKIWLPGDDHTVEKLGRAPMRVAPIIDENGSVSHYEVSV